MIYAYNGIDMELVRTNSYEHEAVHSSDGMDYLFTRMVFDISATVNPATMAYTTSGGAPTVTPGTLPATTIVAIRHALLQPRKQLLVTDFGGQTVLTCPGVGFTVDQKDGPKPLHLDVREVHGARTFLVRWRCECNVLECPDDQHPIILSNRWSDQHAIKANHLAVRSAAGKVVFNKAYLEANQAVADDFRRQFLPRVPRGFQRTHVDVIQNSANTEALWRVTDEERMYDIGETDDRSGGSGIIEITGRQTVVSIPTGSNGPTTGLTMNNLSVTAQGNRLSNQWTMIQRLFELATSIMDIGNFDVGHVVNASVSRSLGQAEKWVELQIGFWQKQTDKDFIGNLNINSLRYDVGEIFRPNGGVNPNLPNDNGTRGTAIATLVAQSLADACEAVPVPGAPGTGRPGTPPGPAGPPPSVTVQTLDELPEVPTIYETSSVGEFPYTSYDLEMKYDTSMNILQAPITGLPDTSGSSGSTLGGTFGSSPPPPTSVVFRTALPATTLTITGTAERIGANPLLPMPQSTDENLVLKRFVVIPNAPTVLNDGVTPVGRSTIYYEYAVLVPPDPTGPNYRVGILPWTSLPPGFGDLVPDDFASGITDDTNGSTGPGS